MTTLNAKKPHDLTAALPMCASMWPALGKKRDEPVEFIIQDGSGVFWHGPGERVPQMSPEQAADVARAMEERPSKAFDLMEITGGKRLPWKLDDQPIKGGTGKTNIAGLQAKLEQPYSAAGKRQIGRREAPKSKSKSALVAGLLARV